MMSRFGKVHVFAVVALMLVVAALAAFTAPPQFDEDRPVIIVSSGSVILTVDKGTWTADGAGRFRQDVARGKDVKSYSATTGSGPNACTVTGDMIAVTYGNQTIRFTSRMLRAGQPRHTDVQFPAGATVNARGANSVAVETNDPLVSFSSNPGRGGQTCAVVGGRLEIRQVH